MLIHLDKGALFFPFGRLLMNETTETTVEKMAGGLYTVNVHFKQYPITYSVVSKIDTIKNNAKTLISVKDIGTHELVEHEFVTTVDEFLAKPMVEETILNHVKQLGYTLEFAPQSAKLNQYQMSEYLLADAAECTFKFDSIGYKQGEFHMQVAKSNGDKNLEVALTVYENKRRKVVPQVEILVTSFYANYTLSALYRGIKDFSEYNLLPLELYQLYEF